jgi:outer membrane protein assembly factor BamB
MRSVRILVLILCACFVSVAWSEQQACKIHTPVGWAEFHRYNMQRWNPCERVLGVNNVGNLVVKWSYATGGNVAFSSAAVASGVVYIGSLDRNVYALNASTGAKLWRHKIGSTISSPAVANGVVYVGSQHNSVYANVYALDAKTGAELWSYATGDSVSSSPAVANGVVYVGSDDGNVYALDAKTGAKLWSYTTGFTVSSSPAVANGVLYIGSQDDKVYAFGRK